MSHFRSAPVGLWPIHRMPDLDFFPALPPSVVPPREVLPPQCLNPGCGGGGGGGGGDEGVGRVECGGGTH